MGLSINDSVYSCVFFFLTGLHFFHLVVGLLLLSLLFWSCSLSSGIIHSLPLFGCDSSISFELLMITRFQLLFLWFLVPSTVSTVNSYLQDSLHILCLLFHHWIPCLFSFDNCLTNHSFGLTARLFSLLNQVLKTVLSDVEISPAISELKRLLQKRQRKRRKGAQGLTVRPLGSS